MGIPRTIEQVLTQTDAARPSSIAAVLEADAAARECARSVIARQTTATHA